MSEDYLDGGLNSRLAKDIYALQNAAYNDGLRRVRDVMAESLTDKRTRYDDRTTLAAEKMQLSFEIDLLRKMILWVDGELI